MLALQRAILWPQKITADEMNWTHKAMPSASMSAAQDVFLRDGITFFY